MNVCPFLKPWWTVVDLVDVMDDIGLDVLDSVVYLGMFGSE
jgi:hypothetical protein